MEGTPSETMLPSVLRAPRVTVVEGPTPSARQSTLSQEAVVVVITAPPGSVVGALEAVIAGVTSAPRVIMLPSEFNAPRVTVAEGPTPRARQTRPLHEATVLVTPEVLGTPVMLGTPVTVGVVAPAPREAKVKDTAVCGIEDAEGGGGRGSETDSQADESITSGRGCCEGSARGREGCRSGSCITSDSKVDSDAISDSESGTQVDQCTTAASCG